MDCFNNGCPFRVNDTSNANRCECTACPNKCTNDVIIVSDHTLSETERKLLEDPNYGVGNWC